MIYSIRAMFRFSFLVGLVWIAYQAVGEWYIPAGEKPHLVNDLKLTQEDLCFVLAKAAGQTLSHQKGNTVQVSRFGGVQSDALLVLPQKWTAFTAADWVAWDYVPAKGCAVSYVIGEVDVPLQLDHVVIRVEGPLITLWNEFLSTPGHAELSTFSESPFILLATGGEWPAEVFVHVSRNQYEAVSDSLWLDETGSVSYRRRLLSNNVRRLVDEWIHLWRDHQMETRVKQAVILLLALVLEFLWFCRRWYSSKKTLSRLLSEFFLGSSSEDTEPLRALEISSILASTGAHLSFNEVLSRASSVGGEVLRSLVASWLESSPTGDSLRVANDKVSAVQGRGDLLTSARRFGDDTVAECMAYLFEGQPDSAEQLIRQKEYQSISVALRTASFQLGSNVEAQVDQLLHQGFLEEARKVIESARARIGFQAQIQNLRAWVQDHSRHLDPQLVSRVNSFDPDAHGAHKELNRLERDVQAVKNRLRL